MMTWTEVKPLHDTEKRGMSIKTGLILSGGGARAAYQVGVLQALAEILPKNTRQPFPIITGTSAGALNALGLAGRPGTFRYRTQALGTIWSSLESAAIYRTSGFAVTRNALRIAWSMLRGPSKNPPPLALLDNQPLRELLEEAVQFTHIERAIAGGELEAIGLTAMNYSNGHSTTFYQGQAHITPWSRARRHSEPCTLGVEHLLASSALPTLFPATRVGQHYFGDGALRQARPLSAAIHLGADRLFIIGVSDHGSSALVENPLPTPPTISQVLGQMLNGVFLDSIDADLETLHRVNALLSDRSNRQLSRPGISGMRLIDSLIISPSQSLSDIARDYVDELPKATRRFLNMTRSIRDDGSGGALSYILFEPGYCQHLLHLGYQDALAQRDRIAAFFDLGEDRTSGANQHWTAQHGPVVRKPLNPIQRSWYQLIGKSIRRL